MHITYHLVLNPSSQAFIALRAGQSIPTPLEWPYTQETNQQQSTDTRLSGCFYHCPLYLPFISFQVTSGVLGLYSSSLCTYLPYVYSSSAHLYASFVCYIGIAYQLPGAFTAERANLLTSHMKAMGLLDSARIMYAHLPLQ